MTIYKARIQIMGGTPKKIIEAIEVSETPKTFTYENNRISKDSLNKFQSKYNDTEKIFSRFCYCLTQEESENCIKEMYQIGLKHFSKLQEDLKNTLDIYTSGDFVDSSPTFRIID